MTACLCEGLSCSLSPQAVLLVPVITIIQPFGKAVWAAKSAENSVCVSMSLFLFWFNSVEWLSMRSNGPQSQHGEMVEKKVQTCPFQWQLW